MPTFDVTTPVLPVPTFTYAIELGFDVGGATFEDHTEQRYLVSSVEGLTLFYEYSLVDSALACQVRSIFLDAQGPATQFVARDWRTGSLHNVRFADEALAIEARPGRNFRVGPIPLRVVGLL